MYDEAWQLAKTANQILNKSTHPNNTFNFDVLAWYIDPSEGAAGFSPHRDRQPPNQEVANSFHEDGQAKYVTLWMALTRATPENSCLYVIPKQYDEGYLKGDDQEDEDCVGNGDGNADCDNTNTQDPLSRCLQSKESYQSIRALPRKPGESIAFTHRILHWGSRGNKNCTDPRIAISFVSSDASFEKPYLRHWEKYWNPEEGGFRLLPPFHVRLLIVCAQLLIYYQRFDLPKETIRACYEYCKENNQELDESYWKKVSLEFVKAMREEKASVGPDNNEDQDDDDDDDDDNDDGDEEALLEAMLENADEVEDDFDDMEDGEGTGMEGEEGEDDFGDSADDDDDDADDDDDEEECNLFGVPGDEQGTEGEDEDDFDGSDDEEECNLFGNSSAAEPQSKKQRKE